VPRLSKKRNLMKTMKSPRKYHIGIDFVDAFGDRVTSVQLVRDGCGIASMQFRNGRSVRQDYCLSAVSAKSFARGARLAMLRSKPVKC
jgi:hypothetical protein